MNTIDGRNVLQSLAAAERNGDMTRSEVLVTIVQLMVNMTTANAIGNMLYRIASRDWNVTEYLCDADGEYEEEKGRRLIEEVLRCDASLQRLPRRCRVEVDDFYGQCFPKNSNVICMIGLGNCDPDIFGDDAFQFEPDRYLNGQIAKPLTFGYGIHLCLGYMLVKREMQLTLRALVECGVKRIHVQSLRRVTEIDVGNYGFEELRLRIER